MIFSLGHSNVAVEDFFNYILHHKIVIIYDVRGIPYSKYAKQFNQPNLEKHCEDNNIKYIHMPLLSGIQVKQNINSPTQNMLDKLQQIYLTSFEHRVLIMGANFDFNKCHRYKLCDWLVQNWDIDIFHIIKDKEIIKHTLTQVQLKFI